MAAKPAKKPAAKQASVKPKSDAVSKARGPIAAAKPPAKAAKVPAKKSAGKNG